MLAYGAFEIQVSKMANPSQKGTPLVYYKSNEGLIQSIGFTAIYPPTGKIGKAASF
jgi:hypothetical protein